MNSATLFLSPNNFFYFCFATVPSPSGGEKRSKRDVSLPIKKPFWLVNIVVKRIRKLNHFQTLSSLSTQT